MVRPGVHATRDVGAVADSVEQHRAAEVAQARPRPARIDAVAGLVVGTGRVLAGGDDREVHPMVTLGQDATRQLGGHVRLGATDERDGTGLQRGARCDRRPRRRHAARAPRRGPSPRATDRSRRSRCGTRCSASGAAGRPRTGSRCGCPTAATRGEPASSATRATGSSVSSHGTIRNTSGRSTTRGASSRGTTSVASPSTGQHQHREALERHGLVPDQPRQVGADREQQHVDLLTGHGGAHPVHPLLVHSAQANRADPDLI